MDDDRESMLLQDINAAAEEALEALAAGKLDAVRSALKAITDAAGERLQELEDDC